jgi:hypothetical protein
MKSKIILSYRRSDSDVITGRIRDRLASRYGEDAVFIDIENIPLGFDFRRQIKDALLQNKIFIAVIGPKWLGGSGEQARIHEENDPVRIEVETALQQGLPVVPVLVSGATMPKATELPASLQALCYLNAAEVDGGRDFRRDMDRLIEGLDQILKATETAPLSNRRKWLWPMLGAVVCLILTAIGIWVYPSISTYVKSKTATQVAVQPAPQPPAAPPPTPAPPPVVITPPPFSSANCKRETASFYDDFREPDAGWNFTPGEAAHYADGQLVITPQQNAGFSTRYLPFRYENVTICAHIKSPPRVQDQRGALAGISFWGLDGDNLYVIEIAPEGAYMIYRKIAGNWITLIPLKKNEHIKAGIDAVNEIRVELIDNFGALFINGMKVQEFRGQPPRRGTTVGVFAESEATFSNEWRFLDVTVMDKGKSKPVVLPPSPSGPTIAGCRPTNSTDFQDTFAAPDPGWALNDNFIHYLDGQLSIKTDKGTGYVALYRPFVFRNVTLCATVKSPPEVTASDGASSGGLAFWASNDRNYYVAKVFPDGRFNLSRKINDEWVTVVPWTPSDVVKNGTGAVNEIQVVLNENKGWLFINGAQLREFRGQLPPDGGAIGVYAQSDRDPDDWRFLNITAIENQ